jgi:hypothetical protein
MFFAAPNIGYVLLLASILIATLLIAGSGTLAYAMTHAQDGFEDETGFHPLPTVTPPAGSSRSEKAQGNHTLPEFVRGLPSL